MLTDINNIEFNSRYSPWWSPKRSKAWYKARSSGIPQDWLTFRHKWNICTSIRRLNQCIISPLSLHVIGPLNTSVSLMSLSQPHLPPQIKPVSGHTGDRSSMVEAFNDHFLCSVCLSNVCRFNNSQLPYLSSRGRLQCLSFISVWWAMQMSLKLLS